LLRYTVNNMARDTSKNTERQIGEKFIDMFDNKVVVKQAEIENSCVGCIYFFGKRVERMCPGRLNELGYCTTHMRSKKDSIIFKIRD